MSLNFQEANESADRAPKPTPKAAPPSEPSMTRGRSVSKIGESEAKVTVA